MTDIDRTVTIAEKTWRALLKIAGRQIDPKTAEVIWHYGQVADPYGVHCDLPDEGKCIGRLYFARNPESEVWIESGDLPEATQAALKNKTIDDDPLFGNDDIADGNYEKAD